MRPHGEERRAATRLEPWAACAALARGPYSALAYRPPAEFEATCSGLRPPRGGRITRQIADTPDPRCSGADARMRMC
jgi:hypothetical protein